MTAPNTTTAHLERLAAGDTYAEVQHRAQAAALELISRAGHDPAGVAAAVGSLGNAELRVVAATLALLVDDELTLRQLKARMADLFVRWPCHPALWGGSWASRAEHGTRARYNAGCRGDACRAADNAYRSGRQRSKPAPAPLQLVVG